MNKFILSIVFLLSLLFGLFISADNLAFAATTPTIVNIPAPAVGQEQGFISAVQGTRAFVINNRVVTHDGDTTINYFGGLTTVSVGNIVNYSYTIDVDGVYLATVMDVYPTQAVSGTERVNRLDVINSTSQVILTLYNGTKIEYFQPYAFITGIGTNTSFGAQLVNYVGFVDPVTGNIQATSGYMSNIPVEFKTTLPEAIVGVPYNQYAINIGIYGMANIYYVSAIGLPDGLVSNMGVISGTPTTPGTYTIDMDAIGGQYNVSPYISNGKGTITLVVKSATPVTPTTIPCSGTDETILGTTARLSSIADVNGNIINAAYASTSTNNIAIPANGVNYTFTGGLTIGSFPTGGLISYTGVYGSALNANGTPMWCIPTEVTVAPVPVVLPPVDLTPSVTLTANGTGLISLNAGDTFELSWTASNVNYCAKYGNWAPTSANVGTSGTEVITSKYPTVVTGYLYSIVCYTNTGSVQAGVQVNVTPAPIVPTPVTPVTFVSSIPSAVLTQAYTGTNLVSTGVAPYTVTATGLPIGMSVSSNGVLSGTPYSPVGTYTIDLTATDSVGTVGTGTVDLVIDAAPVVTVTGNGYIGFVSKFFININGGDTGAAQVYYTPTASGTTFLNGATNFLVGEYVTFTGELLANGVINATSMTVDSIPTPVTFISSLSNATVGVSYTSTSLVSTGTSPYTVTVTGLPSGMSVSTNGVLSGKPTTAGTYNINISATDSRGTVGTSTLSIVVDPAPVIVTPPSTTYTSTGKKAESQGKITNITADTYTVGTVVVRITDSTYIKLENNRPLVIGNQVEYKGIKNTDGSVTATSLKIQ